MNTQPISLRLSFPGEPPTTATGAVHTWTVLERVGRTVLGLGATWLAGVLFIFFPIVHWVAVPACVIAGPIIAILRGTEERRLVEMNGSCPRCKKERVFKLGLRFNGKRSFTCGDCGNLIEMEEA